MIKTNYKIEIQSIRKSIAYQILAIKGYLLENLNEEAQEMFTESILELLTENRGTKSQYMRLLEIHFMVDGVYNYFENYYSSAKE